MEERNTMPDSEDGPATAEADKIKTLELALQEEHAKSERYLANWQRAEADLKNFQKRSEKEKAELAAYTTSCTLLGVLPAVDEFEFAIKQAPPEAAHNHWAKGMNLILKKLKDYLASQCVTPIEAQGKPFDPRYHEAVMRGEGQEGMVLQELRTGYMHKDTVLRPSLVVVGTGKSADSTRDEGPGN